MRAWSAVIGGVRRTVVSPFVLLSFWLLNLLVALPAAWLVQEAIREGIGHSGYYKKLTHGFNMEWFGLFEGKSEGLAKTFTPTHSGMGAFIDNFEALLTGSIFKSYWGVIAISAIFGLLWLTLLGAAIERYCGRGPSFAPFKFVGSGVRYLFRLLRLTMISAPIYLAIFWSASLLMKSMKKSMPDVTVEGTLIFYSMLIWLGVGFLLTLIHAIFGFAKVAIVVDERRSAVLAAIRGFTFIALHPAKTMGMYYALLLLNLVGAVALYFVAPGATQDSVSTVAWAFVLGQLYLLFKLTMRLSLVAGQVALYQAHGMAPKEAPESPTVVTQST
jgi:hypothetical protein